MSQLTAEQSMAYVEITAEMLEAGQAVLGPHVATINPVFIREIYRAMRTLEPMHAQGIKAGRAEERERCRRAVTDVLSTEAARAILQVIDQR